MQALGLHTHAEPHACMASTLLTRPSPQPQCRELFQLLTGSLRPPASEGELPHHQQQLSSVSSLHTRDSGMVQMPSESWFLIVNYRLFLWRTSHICTRAYKQSLQHVCGVCVKRGEGGAALISCLFHMNKKPAWTWILIPSHLLRRRNILWKETPKTEGESATPEEKAHGEETWSGFPAHLPSTLQSGLWKHMFYMCKMQLNPKAKKEK